MSNESRFAEILKELKDAVISYNEEKATSLAQEVLSLGFDPFRAITEGLAAGLKEVGDKFEEGEIFLPHLVTAGSVVDAAAKVLEPGLQSDSGKEVAKGTIVIGTVEGDIHSIGKNIVAMMLKSAGYRVVDAGVDVPPHKFAEMAAQEKAQIIALSALMTFTLASAKAVIEYLETNGLRQNYKVICGGGAVKSDWAAEMGFDGYAEDAKEAVDLVAKIM